MESQGEAYLKKLIEKYPSDTTKVSCGGNGSRKRECRWLSKIKEGKEMGFMDLAQARFSVREYSDRPVEKEKREREVSGSEEVADAVEIVWKVGNPFMDEKNV